MNTREESGGLSRNVAAILTAVLLCMFPTVGSAQEVGPARGALVISGGAETTPHIIDRFIELAGGPDAPIVVVPLRRARGIWFNGGSHWLHTDAYLDTKVHEELFALLDRGGVIGGGSAGAHVQGEIMNVSRSPEREFAERTLPREDWRRGFGLLRGVIIDVHVLARNRQFDLIGVLDANPDMLGIAIDENTAIVVRGDRFEVIGTSYVIIHDDQREVPPDPPETWRTVGGPFYFLRPGDTYDLATREAFRPGSTERPIARIGPRGGSH